MPLKNYRISQEYGRKNQAYRKGYHTGVDLVAIGDATIHSVGTGQIFQVRFAPGRGADPNGWGNYVIVRQGDGHDILYAHLSQISIQVGRKVNRGDKIGIQGSTGNSTGPHLHFEVWKGSWQNRNDVNPADYLGVENKVGNVQVLENKVKGTIFSIDGYIKNGITYIKIDNMDIPLRKTLEALRFKVGWDNTAKVVTIE